MIIKAITLLQSFRKDEDGLALTEYLLLLGLLTGAVILAVIGFGGALGTQWESWNTWLTGSTALTAPAPTLAPVAPPPGG
jgi:pilus assembly protein Flp/PilA